MTCVYVCNKIVYLKITADVLKKPKNQYAFYTEMS